MSVDVSLSGSTVTFTSFTLNDNLYLQMAPNGDLEWSTDGASYSTALGAGGGTLDLLTQNVTIDTQIASAVGTTTGGVTLTGPFATDGHSLTFNATPVGSSLEFLRIESDVFTNGGNFTASRYTGAFLGTSGGGGVTISTRNVGGGDPITGASQGDSGNLTVNVANSDPNNPILNVNFNNPQIQVDAGSQLLAWATGSHSAGEIQLTATNEDNVLDGLSFPTLASVVRQSTVNFQNSTAAAPTLVEGGTIDIEANSGDNSLVQQAVNGVSNKTGGSSDNPSQWGQWVGGTLNTGLQLLSLVPGLNLLKLPLSINYRNAASTVQVGADVRIIGSSDVTLSSASTADAQGQAIWTYNTQFGAAFSYMQGVTNAVTDVANGAIVASTGGGVTIQSTDTTTTSSTARTGQNLNSAPSNAYSIALAVAIGVVDQTATATVEAGATVEAAGSVTLSATGTGTNTTTPSTGTYVTGLAGAALGYNVTNNNIQAHANGTLISGGTGSKPTLSFDPDRQVDYANSAIKASPSAFVGLTTGQALIYSSGSNSPIGGLTNGATYYVIVPGSGSSLPTDEFQLAATLADAMAGNAVTFQQYPTLSSADGKTTVPISDINQTNGMIQFDSAPGFTTGQAVTYQAVKGQAIGGLVDGATYYVLPDPSNADRLQLASQAGSPAIPLNLDPVLQGFQQSLPVTVNPQGLPANVIQFPFDAGFGLGDNFIYQGSGISGLQDGVRYWAIPDPANPQLIQLAASYSDAQAGLAVPIGANATGGLSGGTLVFDPAFRFDATTNTIDMGFNYADVPGNPLASGTSLTYHGAFGQVVSGLVEGGTYYVIQDAANPRLMRLTSTSAAQAQAAAQAGQTSFNTQYQRAYQPAYDAYLQSHPNDTQGASAAGVAAAQAAESQAGGGEDWVAPAIESILIGTAPATGSFLVTVNPAGTPVA